MADNDNIIVKLDASAIENELEMISVGIGGIRTILHDLREAVIKGFTSTQDVIKTTNADVISVEQVIGTMVGTLTSMVSTGMNSVVQGVNKIFETIDALKKEQAMDSLGDKTLQVVDLTFKAMELMQEYSQTGNRNPLGKNTGTLLLPAGNSNGEGDAVSALISSSGNLGELIASNLSTGELVEGIRNVIENLVKSTGAWIANTAAKVASKAEDIAIIGLYAGDFVKAMVSSVAQLAANTAAWVANTAAKVGGTAAQWAQNAATAAWTAICGTATAVTGAFSTAMSVLTSPITWVIAGVAALVAVIVLLIKNWDAVKAAAITAWQGITAALGGAWSWFESKVFNPLVGGVKNGVNSVIGFINGMISAVVKGINGLINVLNQLKFTVPDWVPGLGGSVFGFQLKSLTAPQIPYLATGAVLPANKPFLAVVGDQRHGTNVEAPLATIQEAVAVVLDEQLSALMAGFNATVEELRLLRQTVGDIQIGDAVIGRAAERYREKRAVMYGCGW